MDWLTLDNTAKIYPLMSNAKSQNMFRANAELMEDIIPEVLKSALVLVTPRFPMLTMRLKKGFFWHYLEKNTAALDVYEESPFIMENFTFSRDNCYNFRVMYYKKRISIDFYHVLCDGGAAVEFFKCLIFNYIKLLHKDIENDGTIIDILSPISNSEYEDSFIKNFKKLKIRDLNIADLKGTPAYVIPGAQFPQGKSVTILTLNSCSVLAYSKSIGCSVTEFLSALLVMSAKENVDSSAAHINNFCLFLPINIRKFYNSTSMRNFSMFSRANIDISNSNLTLQDCINTINAALKYGTNKDVLDNRINTTVRPTKFMPMRIMPICIKSFIFNIGNRIFGKAKKSCTLSNLGVLRIPCLEQFVDKFHYQLNTNALVPLNIACSTYKNKLTISLLRNTVDASIIQTFATKLLALNFDVTIESNDWEDNYEV